MVLICLWSGCRREEAAQLFLNDIQEAEGVHFFNLTDEGEGQGLKCPTQNRRKVPVHSSLVSLGFLQYVDSLRQAGETKLFPTLKKQKTTLADATGKWYARLLKRVGLRDKSLVLHGLRHTFITRLSDIGVSEKVKRVLVGNAGRGVHDRVYNHSARVPLRLLQDGIEKLRYEEVFRALSNGQREEAA